MGDKERGRQLAHYIRRHFPAAVAVLSVADGNLVLARELIRHYRVTVYDPYVRNNNRAVRSRIKLVGKPFTSECRLRCHLVVGLHPDQATGEVVAYAIRTRTPCVLVPCCMVGRYARQCGNKARWIKYLVNVLRQNAFDVTVDQIPISGSSTVIRAVPLP